MDNERGDIRADDDNNDEDEDNDDIVRTRGSGGRSLGGGGGGGDSGVGGRVIGNEDDYTEWHNSRIDKRVADFEKILYCNTRARLQQ
jgi:hypothetical protein